MLPYNGSEMKMGEIIALIDEHERASLALFPAYAALLERRSLAASVAASGASTSVSIVNVGGTSATSTGILRGSSSLVGVAPRGSVMSARDLLADSAVLAGSTSSLTRANYPELAGDPALFRLPLIPSGNVWDSMRAASAAASGGTVRVDPMIARLPKFGVDAASGFNTLTIRGEYFMLPDERAYAAVSIGAVPAGTDPTVALEREVIAHVCLRVDPGTRGGPLLQRYLQSVKSTGRWNKELSILTRHTAKSWPVEESRPFFLRITIDPRGVFSYIDGRAQAFTRHSGGQWAPTADQELHMMLPVAGDAGEKVSWRVLGAWWGWCAVDDAGNALAEAYAARTAAQPVTRREVIENELYVTGLREGTTADDVREAFISLAPRQVRMEGASSASVLLQDGSNIAAAVAATDRRIAVLGATVNVVQAQRIVNVVVATQAPPQ